MPEEICAQTDQLFFSTRRIRANTVLVREGSLFGTLYVVGSGSFKCSQSDLEGYEQVLGFALQGDVIGLDGLCEDRQSNTAIALEDSTVAMVPFRDFVRASHELPALERLLHLSVSRELRRKSVAQHVMAAASADVRLVRFLLEITSRHASLGFSSRRLRLRMSRRDIGSYLGVAHETVSRSLKGLAEAGYIGVNHKELEILDRDGLQRLQRNTRGATERVCPSRKGQQAGAQAAVPLAA
ncbi:MAG TPA: Crp/Fnr family transcriptional regulator [Ideonella sp.]|nr:Crp/Fnr family transcriptional regulator [Ideonella sp.]